MSFIINPYRFGVLAPITFTFVASAVSSAATVLVPASSATDDFALLLDFSIGASYVTPTNWTNDRSDVGGSHRVMISHRLIGAGEPGVSITGMDGAGGNRKIVLVFRPSRAISFVTPFSANGIAGTTSNPSAQTISMTGQTGPVIAIGHGAGAPPTVVGSGTLVTNGTVVSNTGNQVCAYEIQNTTLNDRTYDIGDVGTNDLQSLGYSFS